MPKKYIDIYDQLLKNSKWNGACLESTFKKKSKRPPQLTHKGKLISVHRASWIYHNGEIPNGIFVCHHCDNPKCFRIEHLFLGSGKDNMQDMIKKNRDNIFGARKHSLKDLEKIKKLRMEGYAYSQISKMVDIKTSAISAFVNRHGIKKGPSKPRAKKYPLGIIDTIISLKESGIENQEICKKLGISMSTLYRRIKKNF